MNKYKVALLYGVIVMLGFSFSAQVLAADDIKKPREAVRSEIKQDRKEISQDRKEIHQDRKKIDRKAVREAIARKAPAAEISALRSKVKAGEAEISGDKKCCERIG